MSDNKLSVLIIYHKDCTDGSFAAYFLKKVYPDGEFMSFKHVENNNNHVNCEIFNDRVICILQIL